MIWQALTLLSLALCAQGRQIATSEQKRSSSHQELNHIGSHKPAEYHEEYAWSYPSYDFSYSVDDPHTHDKKSQHEKRRGDEVEGEYWLIQPDGKKRTVTYQADKHKGFTAHVQYSDHHHQEDHQEEPRVEEIVEEKEPAPIEVNESNVEDERKEESEIRAYRQPEGLERVTQFEDIIERKHSKPIINYQRSRQHDYSRRHHRAHGTQRRNQ